MLLVRSSLFVVTLFSLVFAFGCNDQTAKKPKTAQQVQQLTEQKTDLQNQLEQTKTENDRLKKQAESLSNLPPDKRADAIYHLKSVTIGRFTNFYDKDKTPGATGKKNLVVYVEPIDETGDAIKAGGTIDVQLWDLNKKESEARLAQWQLEPNEIKTLWLSGALSSGYRLSFDAAGIIDKFDKPLTVKVNFTDYLSGMTFTEQFIIRPPQPAGKK
jgi:outer membrane murein-binding lipoprotein Lpp